MHVIEGVGRATRKLLRYAAALLPATRAVAAIGVAAALLSGCAASRHDAGVPSVLRFGLTADYPPFALHDAQGRLTGADVETARRVARALGSSAEFRPTTWQTLAADFAAGRFDVVIGGITVTPERAALGTYSVRLMEDGKRPLIRCADQARFHGIDTLDRPDVRVMISRGPSMPEVAREFFPHASLVVNRDDDTLVPFLLEGRVDAWVTDGVVVDHMARRHAGMLCASTSVPFTHLEKAWLIRPDARLVGAIDRELAKELRTGRWRRDLEAVP